MKFFTIGLPSPFTAHLIVGATALVGIIGSIYILRKNDNPSARSLAARNSSGKPENEEFCTVCFSRLDLGEFKTCTQCSICSKFVCRGGNKCSEWFPKEGEWKCRLCSGNHTSGWIEDHYGLKKTTQQSYQPPLRARSEIYIPLCDPSDSAFLCNFESISEAPSSMSAEQKYQIREYIEEVMEDILGGTLETTPVGPLSKSDHYAVTGRSDQELRNVSGLRLRRLIESIIAETIRMPSFQPVNAIENQDGVQHQNGRAYNESACNGTMGHYFEPKSYHDLLATAVLNKIVETHGNRGYSESSPNLTTSLDKNHNDLFNAKGTESIITSCSAEPRSESGISESIRNTFKEDETSPDDNFFEDASNDNIEIDRESVLSDFISTHVVPLPHITTDHTSEEEDEDFISVASSGRDQTWEDNWLFKKKKANKTSSTIGMLVPAPKEDIRALIGDKPTDEVSDLSEMESDTDESSLEMSGTKIEPLNDRVASQHLIGGKNTKDVLDELLEQNSLISISSLPENVPKYTETKNEFVKADDADEAKYDPNETVNIDVAKKVSENNLSKPVLEMPNETTKHSSADFTDDEKLHLMSNLHEEQNGKLDSAEEISNSPSPRSSINGALSGSIAEREYKKWYNAVDMPNNPYSVEALKRRLSGGPERVMDLPNISPCKEENPIMLMEHSTTGENDRNQEREYARYSRDYYINDAKHASGTSKRSSNNSLSPSSSNDNIVIESRTLAGVSSNIEVIPNGFNNTNKCDWTLSTPVRRCSSLKFLKQTNSSSNPKLNFLPSQDKHDDPQPTRSPNSPQTQSFIKNSSPSRNVLTQFEKQLLHKDLKRNSFRAISSTTKDFVLNPIFDQSEFFTETNLSTQKDNLSDGNDDAVDSGVDSSSNGVPEDNRSSSILL